MRYLPTNAFQNRAILAFTTALVLAIPAWAQRPPIRRALIATVKADRVGDFEAAVKQYTDVYSKVAGVHSYGTFQSMTGNNQYVMVRDYDKWSELDPSPLTKALAENSELSRINQRILSCVETGTSLVEELLPELSMAAPSDHPNIIRVAHNHIQSGKNVEFEALVKNELLPAYKKAGAKSFTVRRVRFGGSTTDYYLSTRVDGWADAGANALSKSMGEAAYQAMAAKLTALTVDREINLYRFRTDLSYSTPASK